MSCPLAAQIILGINACMRVARRVLSPGKGGTTFTSREIVASHTGAKYYALRGGCWKPKASSPAHCRRGTSMWASPDLRKQELQIIANIKEKYELYLRNIVHFAAAPPRQNNGALLESWATTRDVAFILKWRPARRASRRRRAAATGPGTGGGWHWPPYRADELQHDGGRLERAYGRHAGGAADMPTARRRRRPSDGSPDRQGRPSCHLRWLGTGREASQFWRLRADAV